MSRTNTYGRSRAVVATMAAVLLLALPGTATAQPAEATIAADTGPILLYNLRTERCVDIDGTSGAAVNNPVKQHVCSFNDNQWFELVDSGVEESGYHFYTIEHQSNGVGDGLCLDVPGNGAVAPGTPVSLYYCNATRNDNQLFWIWEWSSYGGEMLVNKTAGDLCLDVTGNADPANGARLTLYNCRLDDDHFWAAGIPRPGIL